MLEDLVEVLRTLNLSDTEKKYWNMNITCSHNVSAVLANDFSEEYFVKIAESRFGDRLFNEYMALEEVKNCLGDSVAHPLGFHETAAHSFLVMPMCHIVPVKHADQLIKIPKNAVRLSELLLSMSVMKADYRPSTSKMCLAKLASSDEKLKSYIERLDLAAFSRMSESVNQHGDMVINNISLNSGSLMIFDWEDYGRIDIPGFDVAILLASITNFDANEMINVFIGKNPLSPFFDSLLDKSRVDTNHFLAYLPIYTGCFLWLKRESGYNAEVQIRSRELMYSLIELLYRFDLVRSAR